jgi:proline dehydrogenase
MPRVLLVVTDGVALDRETLGRRGHRSSLERRFDHRRQRRTGLILSVEATPAGVKSGDDDGLARRAAWERNSLCAMRRLLLWMAGNRWLRDRLPRLWFAKRAVHRFMPGEDATSALDAGTRFQIEGIGTLYTRLGENLTRIEEADAIATHYLEVLDEIRGRHLDGEISVKLTQLGFDLDLERTFAHASALSAKAAETGRTLWIDMEGSAYTEGTIAFYERLKVAHPNTGICLQAYLRRTAADLQRLLPLRPEIRLVKGAYAEPEAIAYRSRHDVDANYLALSVAMLEALRAGTPVRIGLGTHDVRLIEQAAAHAAALGLPKTAFEIQMLYGIRADQQRRLNREGYLVRALIAYGEAWYPWYMRRLAERPANVLFALRQMVG